MKLPRLLIATACLCATACSSDDNNSPKIGTDAGYTADLASVDTSIGDDVTADAATPDAGPALPLIHEANLCDVGPNPNLSVAPGTDLMKVTLDDPLAVCNDGSPAIIYVRPAPAGGADADKWVLWLEGGGSCIDGAGCVDRWCAENPIFSAAKMSSRFAPDGVRGIGVFDRAPANGATVNNFGEFNQVLAYYCSSDTWTGTTDANFEAGDDHPAYSIKLHGHHIVSAIVDTLQAGAVSDDGTQTMPSLNDAGAVLLMGTSAGGGGARQNVDRVGEILRAQNPDVDFRLVVDAGVHNRAADPPEISEEDAEATLDQFWAVADDLRGGNFDASCLEFHADDPRPCAFNTHVLLHHISTPYFVKMDLRDNTNSPGAYPDAESFSRATFELLKSLENVTTFSEENDSYTPGVFAPNCGHHVNLETNDFYRIQLERNGMRVSHHDVLWNWFTGAQPQFVIHDPAEGVDSVCP